jgi:FtsH-binding integral membrane protein
MPVSDSAELMLACAGAALFAMFIVVDTQMMMHKLSPDEYILCAINLYLDVLNLFLHLLRALQKQR